MSDLHDVARRQSQITRRATMPTGVHTAKVSRIGPAGEVYAIIPTQDLRVEYGPLIVPAGYAPALDAQCLIALTSQPGGNWFVLPTLGGGGGTQGPPGPTGPMGPAGAPGSPGAAGAPGAKWYSNVGPPLPGLGIVGDYYLEYPTGDVYEKIASGWVHDSNLTGPAGADGSPGEKWFAASGAPTSGVGIVGDWYLNTLNGDFYEKTGASTWTLRGNLKGPTGATGSTGSAGAPGAAGATGPAGANGLASGYDWLARVSRVGAFACLSGSVQFPITYDTEDYDTANAVPAGTNGITIPTSGYYDIAVTVGWQDNPNGDRYFDIRVNGAVIQAKTDRAVSTTGIGTVQSYRDIRYLVGGQIIQVGVLQYGPASLQCQSVALTVGRIVNPGMVAGNLGQAVKLRALSTGTVQPASGATADLTGASIPITVPGVYHVIGEFDIRILTAGAAGTYGIGAVAIGGAGNTLQTTPVILASNHAGDRMTLASYGFATFPDVGGGAVAAGSLLKLQGTSSGIQVSFEQNATIMAHRIGSV